MTVEKRKMHKGRDEEEGQKSHRRRDIKYEEGQNKGHVKNAKLK